MAIDPEHRYSNEAERANQGIYDDFKLKKLFGLHGQGLLFFFSVCVGGGGGGGWWSGARRVHARDTPAVRFA